MASHKMRRYAAAYVPESSLIVASYVKNPTCERQNQASFVASGPCTISARNSLTRVQTHAECPQSKKVPPKQVSSTNGSGVC